MNQPGTSTGAIAATAGAQSVTGAGVMTYASLTAAAATSTMQVYDGTSTSGLLLVTLSCVANTSAPNDLSNDVVFNTGLFTVVTGSAAVGVIHYRRN